MPGHGGLLIEPTDDFGTMAAFFSSSFAVLFSQVSFLLRCRLEIGFTFLNTLRLVPLGMSPLRVAILGALGLCGYADSFDKAPSFPAKGAGSCPCGEVNG